MYHKIFQLWPLTDGSNNDFLKVLSNSGNIDAYVGDSGSAELHSQQGKHNNILGGCTGYRMSHIWSSLWIVSFSLQCYTSDPVFSCHCLSVTLFSLLLSIPPPFFLPLSGAVSVRVPSSIRAGVQLCGTSVETSPEIVLHQAERDSKDGMTTVTGQSSL